MSSSARYRVFRDHDYRAPEFIPSRIYASSRLSYVKTPEPAPLPPCTLHYHSTYEFVIPYLPVNVAVGGGGEYREYMLQENLVFPFNSEQEHGPGHDPGQLGVRAFMADRSLVQEAAAAAGLTKTVEFVNASCPPPPAVRALANQFVEESRGQQVGSEFMLDLIAAQLVLHFLRTCTSNLPRVQRSQDRIDRDRVALVIEHFHDDPCHPYSLDEVTRLAQMDKFRFIRCFRAVTGKTPQKYLMNLKVERACRYLEKSQMTMTEICIACGFSDPSHFSTVFKREVGMPPSEYRRSLNDR
jgi:AraC family transcriptional regulator